VKDKNNLKSMRRESLKQSVAKPRLLLAHFGLRKGDVRSDDLLIEHKWTGKKSFSLKSDVLEKIVTEAIIDSRMPVLGISLNNNNYVLLTEDDFLEMREKLQSNG
jgi:hypothetical protein